MSLSEQDLAAIGLLLDKKLEQKLAAVQAQDRRRRGYWLWFWVVVFVVSSLATWWVGEQLKTEVDKWVTERNAEFSETKLTYQRQLEQSQKLRNERKAAEKAVAYDSSKSQAKHEADLMGGLISLIGSQAEFNKKFENADMSDPAVLEAYLKNFETVLEKGLNPLGAVVLRNTDPLHNSPDEKLRSADGRESQAPPLLDAKEPTSEGPAPEAPVTAPAPQLELAPATPE